MTIGVKYCGGCNPRYDRKGLLNRLRAAFPENRYEPVREGQSYELVLVLCGCLSACANLAGIRTTRPPVILTAPEGYDAAAKIISHRMKENGS